MRDKKQDVLDPNDTDEQMTLDESDDAVGTTDTDPLESGCTSTTPRPNKSIREPVRRDPDDGCCG